MRRRACAGKPCTREILIYVFANYTSLCTRIGQCDYSPWISRKERRRELPLGTTRRVSWSLWITQVYVRESSARIPCSELLAGAVRRVNWSLWIPQIYVRELVSATTLSQNVLWVNLSD